MFAQIALAPFCKLAVHLLAASVELDRTENPIAAVFHCFGQQAEGAGLHPGVLIEQVNVAVALFQGPSHTQVVGGSEPQVIALGEYFYVVSLQPLYRTVCRTVVDDEQIGREVGREYG